MAPSRHKAGFTLIELMIVVSIIGISLLAFAPSFSASMADRRAATASMELVRLGRRARSESIGLSRAFLLYVRYGVGAERTAIFQLLRGNSTHCDIENWTTHAGDCALGNEERNATACMENINLSSSHWFHAPYAITVGMWSAGQTPSSLSPDALIRAVASGASGSIALCYEPSGVMRWSDSALGLGMIFSHLNTGAAGGGGLMFAVGLVDRSESTPTLANIVRVSLFPLGTTPRRLR